MNSQLIGSGLSNCPSDQVRAKVVCCKSLTTLSLDQWLINHQGSVLAPTGSSPMANRWPNWRVSYSSAEVQSAYSTIPPDRASANGYDMSRSPTRLFVFCSWGPTFLEWRWGRSLEFFCHYWFPIKRPYHRKAHGDQRLYPEYPWNTKLMRSLQP